MNRATAAAPPTPIEFLRGHTLRDGSPVPDDLLVTEACRYLDELEAAARGRGASAARTDLAPGSDAAFTHERRLHSFCDHHVAAVGEHLFEEAQLALVCGYIAHPEERADPAGPGKFVAWLFTTLGMEMPADFAVTEISPLPRDCQSPPRASGDPRRGVPAG